MPSKAVDGNKVLVKVGHVSSPLVAREKRFMTVPTEKNYTAEPDYTVTVVVARTQGCAEMRFLPDLGVVRQPLHATSPAAARDCGWCRLGRTAAHRQEP